MTDTNNKTQETQLNFEAVARKLFPTAETTWVEKTLEALLNSPSALKALGLCKIDLTESPRDKIGHLTEDVAHYKGRALEAEAELNEVKQQLGEAKQQLKDARYICDKFMSLYSKHEESIDAFLDKNDAIEFYKLWVEAVHKRAKEQGV